MKLLFDPRVKPFAMIPNQGEVTCSPAPKEFEAGEHVI